MNCICVQCGTQFPDSVNPPNRCPICEDERQYVGPKGQQWTTMDELRSRGFKNRIRLEEQNLISILTRPSFAIGQQCYLVITKEGNLLWDCISLLDEETIRTIRSHGAIKAIAISHPHFYSTMNEWSTVFDDAPIYLHSSDKSWVMHPTDAIHFWSNDTITVMDGLTLIRLGGHFTGSTVARWSGAADGKAVILSGDTIQVCMDRKSVSFMYSFPNYIPVSRSTINHIMNTLSSYEFERIYGGFEDRKIISSAKAVLEVSARRYIEHLERNPATEPST